MKCHRMLAAVCVVFAAAFCLAQAPGGTGRAAETPRLYLQQTPAIGEDLGRGNIVAVQPFMLASDYADRDSYFAKLDAYLAAATAKGWLNDKTVVVFPEYLGTWLVAAEESREVYAAATLQAALEKVVFRHLIVFGGNLVGVKAEDKVVASVFHTKARLMASIYDSVFSELAAKYRVTLVAGSIILPNPSIRDGKLAIGWGSLYNVSVVYRPDGTPDEKLTRKSRPVTEEQKFLAAASPGELPVYETPAGTLAVLICADAFYPESYAALSGQGVDIIVMPAHGGFSEVDFRTQLWPGYNGSAAPADVDPKDIGKLTERQAWLKYALPGRIASAGARNGVTVFLLGALWDLASGGTSIPIRDGQVQELESTTLAALINIWLP